MKTIETDIGHAAEIHRLYLEFLDDIKSKDEPKPDIWLYRYKDPTFFCLYMKHGKKPCGIVFGRMLSYLKEPKAHVEGFFVRRGFRDIKFVRGLALALKGFLNDNECKRMICSMPRERAEKKKLKPSFLLIER